MLQHIAFIMDGNGRWATARGLSRLEGHKAGVDALRHIITALVETQVPYATFYAFSTENWRRPAAEVTGLMALLQHYLEVEVAKLIAQGVKIRILGDISETSPIPAKLRAGLAKAMADSAHNTKLTLGICLNYGGRDEIARAASRLAAQGTPITPETLSQALDTHGMPDPDLIIRTSGEHRLSNFLPWQAAYAELYFSPVLWPDFGPTDLATAIADFAQRERRFGTLPKKQAGSHF